MKNRFSTIDIIAIVSELQKYIGMRVLQVYDIDHKTYLLKLHSSEQKVIILLESGIRIHTTEYDWPKNPSPSGFSMKMRKHLKNRRLEKLAQVGTDRILDLQFGINEAAYHVILELYDKGNIVLTDYEYTILNILRPRATGDADVKFAVREKYPLKTAVELSNGFNRDDLHSALSNAKNGDNLKKILMPRVTYGPALLDHVLLKNNFPKNSSINKDFNVATDIHRLFLCLEEADVLMKEISEVPRGYVIQKIEKKGIDTDEIIANIEFHPYLFYQHKDMKYAEHPSFDKAVDFYFSSMEGQKIDLKALQKEKEALKKLANIKKDHEQRVSNLHKSQLEDVKKAQLIEMNLDLVDRAITSIRYMLANQLSWTDIEDMVKKAQLEGDPVAKAIKKLKLDINNITLLLSNPDVSSDDETDNKPQLVDIDLGCSTYANSRKYYTLKRAHANKEKKTLESSEKAFKNAEKKTKQALKEVAVISTITKSRKVMWFEKFLWFISSENFLVIAGRDIQQNELLVKRYLNPGDLYVHADLHGASSVVIKNPSSGEVPPKTLNEAGSFAVCNSTAWDMKVVSSSWWVYHHQVSKTAPTGEYLTTGSFMIRGKKNFLPPAMLIMGFGFMFKLDEDSVERHKNERCIKSEDFETQLPEKEENLDNEDVHSVESSEEEGSDEASKSDPDSSPEIEANDSIPDVNNENVDQSSEESDDEFDYPDTEVKLDVVSENQDVKTTGVVKKNELKIIIQESLVKLPNEKANATQNDNQAVAKTKQQPPKRGQRSKLKKIKEKYKYQDEEERELRMKILGSAGQVKEDKKSKNKKVKVKKHHTNQPKQPKSSIHFTELIEEIGAIQQNVDLNVDEKNKVTTSDVIQEADESDEDELEKSVRQTEELQLLNSLTGLPQSEDALIFAVPVCAPYASMLNFKYKVKIIPGTNRRGKASKTALNIFLHDKAATSRERDLLRSMKDQDVSRNIPGKIKISTASYKKVK